MPRPIPQPVRETIWARHDRGDSVATIAAALQLSERTVRHLVGRFKTQGSAGLLPSYRRCGTTSDALQAAMACRRLHTQWGAGIILAHRRDQHPDQQWPCERTLERGFRKHNLTPAPPGRKPQPHRHRATQPHAVWQMDAAEHIRLQNAQEVSWLRLVDECSGAFLRTTIFPPRGVGRRAGARGA
jgi:winged helix-turn helix protein